MLHGRRRVLPLLRSLPTWLHLYFVRPPRLHNLPWGSRMVPLGGSLRLCAHPVMIDGKKMVARAIPCVMCVPDIGDSRVDLRRLCRKNTFHLAFSLRDVVGAY